MYFWGYFVIILRLFDHVLCQPDYWDEDFDENQNCEDEELFGKLMKEKYPPRCVSKYSGNNKIQWEECKKDLSEKLVQYCGLMYIEKTGDLVYCNDKGRSSCCFHNETCSENYSRAVHDKMTNQSIQFLENPKKFLSDMVKQLKYDTCHAIEEYDASQCEEDCRKLGESEFAKNCTQNAGLYKCCIRRDKEFCHECRFCCTLSICTTAEGTFYRDSENVSSSENSQQSIDAQMGYSADHKMWKNYDYRCLKPKKDVKSEHWPHYDMNGYRAAKSQDELNVVMEIEFDKYFFNFEDPTVFREMMKGEERENLWRKTFGFDYVSFNGRKNSRSVFTKCYINCFKAEQKSFARQCKEKGGLFKCCMSVLGTRKFEEVRYTLAKRGLIKMDPNNRICVNTKTIDNFSYDSCHLCTTTHICTVKHPLTEQVEDSFNTVYENAQHSIGGRPQIEGRGLKYWACHVQDTCKGHAANYEPHTEFEHASTSEELCGATQIVLKGTDKRNSTFQDMYYKECMKQKSPNVFICPNNKNFKPNSNDTSNVTNILRNLEKKMEREENSEVNEASKKKKKERRKGLKEKLHKTNERKRKDSKKKASKRKKNDSREGSKEKKTKKEGSLEKKTRRKGSKAKKTRIEWSLHIEKI